MKKIFTLALLSIMAIAANATDLFTGSKHVSWDDGGIDLEAAKFADAKAGDKIVVTFTGASDGMEFKVMDNWDRVPGSLQWCPIDGKTSVELFLTPAAVTRIKAGGLQIIGANFTATKVELVEGKDNVTENTVWTGLYWMDSWSTLELAKTSFDGINWANYKAIRFYSEAKRTNYVINVMTSWDASAKIADQNTMNMTNDYAELSLAGIDMPAFLAKGNALMVQCNKEGGDAFNFTSIELVSVASGIQSVSIATANSQKAYNLAGQQVSTNAKGMIISNGRKFINK